MAVLYWGGCTSVLRRICYSPWLGDSKRWIDFTVLHSISDSCGWFFKSSESWNLINRNTQQGWKINPESKIVAALLFSKNYYDILARVGDSISWTQGAQHEHLIFLLPEIGYHTQIGIGTGNPGVFQGYPHPYPRKPVPVRRGTGFDGCGYGFRKNPRVLQPARGYDSKTLQETLQEQCGCQLTPPCSLARIRRSCRHHRGGLAVEMDVDRVRAVFGGAWLWPHAAHRGHLREVDDGDEVQWG